MMKKSTPSCGNGCSPSAVQCFALRLGGGAAGPAAATVGSMTASHGHGAHGPCTLYVAREAEPEGIYRGYRLRGSQVSHTQDRPQCVCVCVCLCAVCVITLLFILGNTYRRTHDRDHGRCTDSASSGHPCREGEWDSPGRRLSTTASGKRTVHACMEDVANRDLSLPFTNGSFPAFRP